jgi:hypothetical protein
MSDKERSNGSGGRKVLHTGLGVALLAGSGYLVYRIGKNIVENIRANREEGQYSDPDKQSNNAKLQAMASQIATLFSAAFNPSGVSWMRSVDGTDEDQCYKNARDMNVNKIPWSMVSTAYKGVFSRDLLQDLQSEMSTSEMNTFNTILNSKNPNNDYQSAISGLGKIIFTSPKFYKLVS